jgi:arylsulfatase A-like enzyme
MEANDERLKKFSGIANPQRRTYAAMLSAMDDAIGQVCDKLRSAGLEENTLVFFFSDNGGPTMPGTTINASSNAPLRGSKRTTLEGGVRVPFVVSWKGKLPAGKVYEQPVIQLDLLPTALAATGVPAGPEAKLDGVNLLPYLSGEKQGSPHDALYWRLGNQMAVRQGNWKLVRYDPAVDSGARSGRGGANTGAAQTARLYDLAADIGEAKDLAAEQPQRVQQLTDLYQAWNAQLAPPQRAGGNRKNR